MSPVRRAAIKLKKRKEYLSSLIGSTTALTNANKNNIYRRFNGGEDIKSIVGNLKNLIIKRKSERNANEANKNRKRQEAMKIQKAMEENMMRKKANKERKMRNKSKLSSIINRSKVVSSGEKKAFLNRINKGQKLNDVSRNAIALIKSKVSVTREKKLRAAMNSLNDATKETYLGRFKSGEDFGFLLKNIQLTINKRKRKQEENKTKQEQREANEEKKRKNAEKKQLENKEAEEDKKRKEENKIRKEQEKAIANKKQENLKVFKGQRSKLSRLLNSSSNMSNGEKTGFLQRLNQKENFNTVFKNAKSKIASKAKNRRIQKLSDVMNRSNILNSDEKVKFLQRLEKGGEFGAILRNAEFAISKKKRNKEAAQIAKQRENIEANRKRKEAAEAQRKRQAQAAAEVKKRSEENAKRKKEAEAAAKKAEANEKKQREAAEAFKKLAEERKEREKAIAEAKKAAEEERKRKEAEAAAKKAEANEQRRKEKIAANLKFKEEREAKDKAAAEAKKAAEEERKRKEAEAAAKKAEANDRGKKESAEKAAKIAEERKRREQSIEASKKAAEERKILRESKKAEKKAAQKADRNRQATIKAEERKKKNEARKASEDDNKKKRSEKLKQKKLETLQKLLENPKINKKEFETKIKNNTQNLNALKQNMLLAIKRESFVNKAKKKPQRSNNNENAAQEATRLFNVSGGVKELNRGKNDKNIDPIILKKIRNIVPFGIGGKMREKFIKRVRGSQNTRGIIKELEERESMLKKTTDKKVIQKVVDSNVSMNTLRELVEPKVEVRKAGRALETEKKKQGNNGFVKQEVTKFKRAASNVVAIRQAASEKKTMEQLRKVTQQLKKNENTKKKLVTATAPQRVAIARKATAEKTRGGKKNTVSNLFKTGLPPVRKLKPTKEQLINVKKMRNEKNNVVEREQKIQALLAKYNRSKKPSKIHREINDELRGLGHKGLPPRASNVGGQTGKAIRNREKAAMSRRKKSQ